MRKIVNSTYITLDGAVEDPHLWPSLGDSAKAVSFDIQMELLDACDVILMGRRTYETSPRLGRHVPATGCPMVSTRCKSRWSPPRSAIRRGTTRTSSAATPSRKFGCSKCNQARHRAIRTRANLVYTARERAGGRNPTVDTSDHPREEGSTISPFSKLFAGSVLLGEFASIAERHCDRELQMQARSLNRTRRGICRRA